MKYNGKDQNLGLKGPTPHGVGGLKFQAEKRMEQTQMSHPARGGWIEIPISSRHNRKETVPPRTGWVD